MFLKKSQFKASTLCASSALLVLGGFMSVNLAGCGGGGGGGGGFGQATATPAAQTISFRLVRQNMAGSNGGAVTLTSDSGAVLSATANSTGVASIASVPPGTYTVKFTVVDDTGANLSTTNSTIIITRASGQTFLLLQDQGVGAPGGFTVSGTIRLNPGVAATPVPTATATATGTATATATGTPTTTVTPTTTGTPTATATASGTATATSVPTATATANPFQFANCTTSSGLVTDTLLVEAIDLDTSKGRPIIAQLRRSASAANRGAYTITLPYRPAAFQIRVSQFDVSGARYAGFSPFSNFNGVNTVTNLNVCVNSNGIAPQIPPVVTFTPTPTPTFFFGTATATPAGGTGGFGG